MIFWRRGGGMILKQNIYTPALIKLIIKITIQVAFGEDELVAPQLANNIMNKGCNIYLR